MHCVKSRLDSGKLCVLTVLLYQIIYCRCLCDCQSLTLTECVWVRPNGGGVRGGGELVSICMAKWAGSDRY